MSTTKGRSESERVIKKDLFPSSLVLALGLEHITSRIWTCFLTCKV